jgi:hypothetical protein
VPPVFSFDSSAFINPARRYYPFDVAPSFWKAIESRIANGEIIATEIVKEELEQKDDALTEWAKAQEGLFIPVDGACQANVKTVVNKFPNWVDADSGKNNADPFVIGLGLSHQIVVVSDENGGSNIHPKIPWVCQTFSVKHMRVLEFIRHIKLVM